MKRKVLWCGFLLVLIAAGTYTGPSLQIPVSAGPKTDRREAYQRLTEQEVFEKNKVHRAKLIARPPDPSVTDEVALGLVLRFVSGNATTTQREQVRRYMSDVLEIKTLSDQNHLFSVAEIYRSQSNQIQMRSESTTHKYHPEHNSITIADQRVLDGLAQEKKTLARNSKNRLQQQLSRVGWQSLNRNLAARVMPRITAVRSDGQRGGE